MANHAVAQRLPDCFSRTIERFATEIIRDVLTKCPDEITQPGTIDLPFITDTADRQLRDSLRHDIGSTNAALVTGQYKSATLNGRPRSAQCFLPRNGDALFLPRFRPGKL